MKKLLPIIILIILVAGGGSFYGGMQYANSKKSSNSNLPNFSNLSAAERQQRLQQFGAGRQDNGQSGPNSIAGEIIAKDDKSLTIKLRDGGSKIVFFSASTEIMKSVAGVINDLKVGDNITTNGQTNSDGSLTAQSISLRNLNLPLPSPNTNIPANP
ncbi:MAG: hypothetical protein V1712_02670 [Patescibacteria group bacterium]